MSTKRKTSKDYKADLADLKKKQVALEARIVSRCKEMIQQNPKVSMGTIKYANAPEKELFVEDYLQHIDRYDMNIIFELMEIIEADSAARHPHKQIKIQEFLNFK
jgi:hypothetical protein